MARGNAAHRLRFVKNFAESRSLHMVGAMAAPMRPVRRSLPALLPLVIFAGCAQFSWSGQGPGAPGRRVADTPTAAAPTDRPLPALDEQEPEPFRHEDRERIANVQPWVQQSAKQYELDPDLINAMIWVESRFVVRAKSPAGARGLMQLMPATANALARQLGRPAARVYDPQFNVQAGSYYLLQMLDRFDGDETLALAAYNAGAGNVNKWLREDGGLPPRSLEYVHHVQHARRRFLALRGTHPAQPSPDAMLAAAETTTEVPPPPPRTPKPTLPQTRRSVPDNAPPPAEPTVENPLAPAPDVYRPEPPTEPPLAETPYPPREPRVKAEQPDDADEAVEIRTQGHLPSVLD